MHNGPVNNNNTMSENINDTSTQMTSNNNKQVNFDSTANNNSPEDNVIMPEGGLEVETNGGPPKQESDDAQNSEDESVDITISNVVTNFNVKCHLNLRTIATKGSNVVYRRDQSIILMKLRKPNVTASIWSSGKITCTGATTEESAKCASRKVARVLQKLGFRVKFGGYRVVNVLGACRLPFGIKIHEFSDVNRPLASYEPELHPGATYRISELKAVLKIFQTGSITITAPSVRNVQRAVEYIYPLVYEYRKPKPKVDNNSKKPCPISVCDEVNDKDALMYDNYDTTGHEIDEYD
ncbi:hypothetical protein RDWZM_009627 [Blomia tropicalis]|uniref:TATA box-binding protein-like 1 n=1 Tax=Blomia tropicalis TaxID=40697 RepID=A0A9Q0RLH5_BLOTA|nr:hypothetical protein RDWZM_009627 [Blomia tropicalis]